MFTWIPIHEETAKRLLDFKDRNHELVDILARMHAAGLKATPINDQGKDGERFPLKEIEPFTFLANFNRGTKHANRQAMWQVLKDEWGLISEVPQDFDGLPCANKQNSWMMPYAKDRSPEHVPLLWEFYAHIMAVEPEELDVDLMQQCLKLPQVGLAFLTMGMFWACPKKWIATDRRNLEFAESKGVTEKTQTADDYLTWLPKIRETIDGDGVEFSRQAWIAGMGEVETGAYGTPFNKMFPTGQADQVLDVFKKVLELIDDELSEPERILAFTTGSKSKSIPSLTINIGMWWAFCYQIRSGIPVFYFLLPRNHPEFVRLRPGDSGQFADLIDGQAYAIVKLPEKEFLTRFDELWPASSEALRQACRHFANRKGTPYLRFHRPELVALATDPIERQRILKEGLPVRSAEPSVADRRYWLIAPGEGARLWEQWQEQGIAAIGWPKLGDLTAYNSKESILDGLDEQSLDLNKSLVALMLWNISREIKKGDIVFAKLGRTEVIGWGEVAEEYSFSDDQEEYPHVVAVDWKVKKAVKILERKLAIKALTEITQRPNLLKILAALYPGVPGLADSIPDEGDDDMTATESEIGPVKERDSYSIEDALSELFMSRDSLEHILEQLKRKKNIILQGAPGVGKTFIAKRLAWLQLGEKDESAVEMVQFHQSYTYEDFVQGLRPTKDGHFAVKDGCFYRLCRKALANPQQDFFLVIDEINRGNLSKILGELMMLIETDKRGQTLTLAYSEEPFTVPPNIYLIGTMNTADRSLSLVDYALRRRFAFLTLDPGFETDAFSSHLSRHGLTGGQIHHIRMQMAALNLEIAKDEANLGTGYRIGHSFFTPMAPVPEFRKWFQSIVRYEIMPLLEEYWIDDPSMVRQFRATLTESIP